MPPRWVAHANKNKQQKPKGEKMKKTLLSVIAGLAVINVASAAPSVADRKALCEKHPDKYVWVAKTEACVPINPCKSDSSTIQEAYCNRVFKDVQLDNWRKGATVVEEYARNNLGVGVIIKELKNHGVEAGLFGQDYVRAVLDDGGYMVFEFDDLSDLGGADVREGAGRAACAVYGGAWSSFDGNRRSASCSGVSEAGCAKVAELMTELRDGTLVSHSYEAFVDGSGYSCFLILEK